MNNGFRKDVSNAEIDILMKPHLEQWLGKVVPRKPIQDDPEEKPEYRKPADKRESQKADSFGKKADNEVSEEQRGYLKNILELPYLSVVARAEVLGLSSYKNNEIKKELLKNELATEFTMNLGSQLGGLIKMLRLTEKGFKVLGKIHPQPRKHQCSDEHFIFQEILQKFYKGKGYEAVIEGELCGKHVDVLISKRGKTLAIEVQLTPETALFNIKDNLEAGFSKVIMGCRNARVLKAIESKVEIALTKEQKSKVKLLLLSEFTAVKEMIQKTRCV